MRLFSSTTMFVIGALLLVPSFTEANALTLRKNGVQTEVETSMTAQEDAPVVNRTQTTSRGTIKFHMKMPFGDADGLARRPRVNRIRSTTMRSSAVFRDSLETDDVQLRNAPVVNRNPVAAKRLNRFRTTTVPSALNIDSLEQDDDMFVVSLKPAVPRLEKTHLSAGSRFNRFPTTTARFGVSRDSVEMNDVSLEDLIVVAQPAPMVNRALTAPRSRGRSQMKTSLDPISPSTSTLAPTTPVDSTEKIDLLTEDLEKTTLVFPATTLMVTELETATTEEIVTTTMPTILVSLRSDEQEDVFVTERTTVTPEPTSDLVDTTVTMVQLTTQSDEQQDFERVVALDRTQLADQLNNGAMTILISQQFDEQDDWTVSMPTSTMAPVITRSPLVSRGRGRFQSSTPTNQITRNRLNRVRLHPMKSFTSLDSDEQENGMVKQIQITSRTPASGNRFSRVRTTTVRPPVFRDSVERNDVSLEDLIFVVPTTRRSPMTSRFSRFRTTTTSSAVTATVGQETVVSTSEIPNNKSRFSRVRSTTALVPVSLDSDKEESLVVAKDFSRMKANRVPVRPMTSNGPKVMPNGNPLTNRGRGMRGRMTTTATPISSHSVEDFSLEDALKEFGKTGEQLSIQQPASHSVTVEVAVPLSDIFRHSDEHDEVVDVPVTSTAAVTLVVVTNIDVSDELPTTKMLDPVSVESAEQENIAFVLVDQVVPVTPVEISLQMVDLPDMRDEAPHVAIVNPITSESEEPSLTKLTK